MYLVTADEMRAFDAVTIAHYGIPGAVLMENAGRTTFQILLRRFDGSVRGIKATVLCGPGNNGGDGYVIARYLINHGADVQTFLLSPREKIKGDALINLKVLERMTARIFAITDAEAIEVASRVWHAADVIVDAILGTGLDSEVRSPYREAIEKANDAPALKLAVDLPSGLNADNGKVMGVAIKADLTATYGFRKIGTAIHPGRDYSGHVEVVDISIPVSAVEANPPQAELYEVPDAPALFRLRADAQGHKGTFGSVLVVGGSPGKTGAPAMAATAAAKIGAGLVTAAIPASLNAILETKLTEEMSEPLPESLPGYLGQVSVDRILSLAQGKACMVLGPGLSTREGIAELVTAIVTRYEGWLVIDADGLNALAENLETLKAATARVVLTPHPGEMGRLTGTSSKAVQQDRLTVARKMATDFGVWVILKGAGTVTAFPDGRVIVNPTGNAWMASGGQGDALSGILGGLLAQGIAPEEALPFGVYLHGLAADRIVERVGPAPVTATDVIAEIPALLGALGRKRGAHVAHAE